MPWRYEELRTAKEWGMRPQEFDALMDEDKAEMIAFGWAKNLLESWTYSKAEAKSRATSRRRS